jgi:hypothetical protein
VPRGQRAGKVVCLGFQTSGIVSVAKRAHHGHKRKLLLVTPAGIAGYGQFALGREEFLKLGPEVAAVRCADCEHCSVQCPHGVHVSTRLRRAQELFA